MTPDSPAVRAVGERHNVAVDLILHRINQFLDVSEKWTIVAASLEGHLGLVQRLSARYPAPFERCCQEAMDAAAGFGHLSVVQWLHSNRTEGCTTDAMDMAAANGHLEVVQWLHEHRKEGCTTSAMDFAAQHGHFRVVEWLHTNRKEGCTTAAVDNAAKEGHLDVLAWLHANRSEGCTKSALFNACDSGHRHIIQWLLRHRQRDCRIVDSIERMVACHNFDMARWLLRVWKDRMEDGDYTECNPVDEDEESTQVGGLIWF